MSNGIYTVKLKSLMENPQTKPLLEKALSTYPIYIKKSVEKYKPVFIPTREELNSAILNHYKYREIGTETVGEFLDKLEITMNEIMPYYNELMFTADQDFDILFNVDYQRTTEIERAGKTSSEAEDNSSSHNVTKASDTSTTNSNMSADGKTVNSETPQNKISIPASDIDSVDYADKVQWDKNGTTSNASTTGNNEAETDSSSQGTNKASGTSEDTERSLETTRGNFGVVSSHELIAKYRDIIVNIKKQIIEDPEIQDLFMMIY